MKTASITVSGIKISYIQVLYDNRYFKIELPVRSPQKILMIPCTQKHIVEAIVDGLIRKESGCNSVSNGVEGEKYFSLYRRFEKFIDRVQEKDKWLDRN